MESLVPNKRCYSTVSVTPDRQQLEEDEKLKKMTLEASDDFESIQEFSRRIQSLYGRLIKNHFLGTLTEDWTKYMSEVVQTNIG